MKKYAIHDLEYAIHDLESNTPICGVSSIF